MVTPLVCPPPTPFWQTVDLGFPGNNKKQKQNDNGSDWREATRA